MGDERAAARAGWPVRNELEREGGDPTKIQEYREAIRNTELYYKSQRIRGPGFSGPGDGPDGPSGLARKRDLEREL